MSETKNERNIVRGIIILVLADIPQWLSSVWSLFCNKPLYEWLQEKGIAMPHFSLLWITWPIGLLLLGVLVWNSNKENKKSVKLEPSLEIDEVQAKVKFNDGRVIVDITPKELTGLYRDHMTLQADRLAQDYIEKWIMVSGVINDISPCKKDGYFKVQFSSSIETISTEGIVIMYFSKKWFDNLSVLKRGKKISVLGKIKLIDQLYISLDDCELIEPR